MTDDTGVTRPKRVYLIRAHNELLEFNLEQNPEETNWRIVTEDAVKRKLVDRFRAYRVYQMQWKAHEAAKIGVTPRKGNYCTLRTESVFITDLVLHK